MDLLTAILRSIPDAKRLTLLYRKSKDGALSEFHDKYDGEGHTLTIIKTTDKTPKIFGGYTPIKWDSEKKGHKKGDGRTFLFAVKPDGSIEKFPSKSDCEVYHN